MAVTMEINKTWASSRQQPSVLADSAAGELRARNFFNKTYLLGAGSALAVQCSPITGILGPEDDRHDPVPAPVPVPVFCSRSVKTLAARQAGGGVDVGVAQQRL